MNITV